MATFKGNKVLAGVNWTVTKESITITCYPSRKTYKNGKTAPYKLTTKSWKNYCPECKTSGKLNGHGTGPIKCDCKETSKWGLEGQVYCMAKNCGADFCGVTGQELSVKSRSTLTPAGNVNSPTASESSVNKAMCELSKAQAIKEGKKLLAANKESEFKADAVLPMSKNLRPGQKIELSKDVAPHTRQTQFFVNELKIDISNQTMTPTLGLKYNKPDQKYQAPSSPSSSSSSTPANTNNVSSVNPYIAIKADSEVEKTLKLVGKKLKSITKIYNFFHVNGSGGFQGIVMTPANGNWGRQPKSGLAQYSNGKWTILNPGSPDNPSKLNRSSMREKWNSKKLLCVPAAWGFRLLCKGIGVNLGVAIGLISNSQVTNGGHAWNKTKGGKIWDCTGTGGAPGTWGSYSQKYIVW